jgi:hypothetical protein
MNRLDEIFYGSLAVICPLLLGGLLEAILCETLTSNQRQGLSIVAAMVAITGGFAIFHASRAVRTET